MIEAFEALGGSGKASLVYISKFKANLGYIEKGLVCGLTDQAPVKNFCGSEHSRGPDSAIPSHQKFLSAPSFKEGSLQKPACDDRGSPPLVVHPLGWAAGKETGGSPLATSD